MSCRTPEGKHVFKHEILTILTKIKEHIDGTGKNGFEGIYKDRIMYVIYMYNNRYEVALRIQTVNVLKPETYEYEWYNVETDTMTTLLGVRDSIPEESWNCCFYVYPHSSAYRAVLNDEQPIELFTKNRNVEIFIVDLKCTVYNFKIHAKEGDNIKDYARRIGENKVCDITIL